MEDSSPKKSRRGNRKIRRFFANRLHRDTFFIIVISALLPMLIAMAGVFYVSFHTTARNILLPDVIETTVTPAAKEVLILLSVLLPLVIAVILFWGYRLTHRITGPFDRIISEMDRVLRGELSGPLKVRKDDVMKPLVDRINALLAK